jgi:hypothetical protein
MRVSKLALSAIVIFMLSFSACIKHATAPISTGIIDFAQRYSVLSYIVNGVEYKNNYAGYEYQFSNAGLFTANLNGTLVNADFLQGNKTLEIKNFATAPNNGLNYVWNVTYINSDKLDLYISTGVDERRLVLQMIR